jgi:23S rRNA (pseudouridine1915-N3)-methyltransferase
MVYCVFVGSFGDKRLLHLAQEYHQRLQRLWPVSLQEIPEKEKTVLKYIEERREKGVLVSLDPYGETMDSPSFGRWVTSASQDLYFIGWGASGPPPKAIASIPKKLSLSSMTYSHEIARVLLMEQLYRAGAALRGHPYPHH